MATSSGLYNDRVKNIMSDKGSEDSRAHEYKESVEIKQQKNKIEKLDEATRKFQHDSIFIQTKSEEHLGVIAKNTKILASESRINKISSLIGLISKGAIFWKIAKWIDKRWDIPVLRKNIGRLDDLLKRKGFGARGMMNQCCCDGSGIGGRMGGRGRASTNRRPGTSRGSSGGTVRGGVSGGATYEARRRSAERMENSRRSHQDRMDRIRRHASDLRQRKVNQVQAKHTADAINKSMRRMSKHGAQSAKGIFDGISGGLSGSAKTIGKAANVGRGSLIKTGLAAVGGIVATFAGLFTGVAGAIGGALATGLSSIGLGGLAAALAKPGAIATGSIKLGGAAIKRFPLAAAAYGLYKGATFDTNEGFGTSKYSDNSGLGDQYIGRSSTALSNTLKALTFGFVDLDHMVGSSGKALNEAYFKKHGKHLGAAENFAQFMQQGDDTIGSLFGMERGLVSTGGNYVGSQLYKGYRELKSYFFGIEEAIEEQTGELGKRLDTNFKDMKMDRQTARALTEEDKRLAKGWNGIPGDQNHNIPFSHPANAPKTPQSYQDSDGPASAFTSGAQAPSAAATRSHLLAPFTVLTGETVRSKGWSQFDALGYSEPTPEGFTGNAGQANQRLSTKTVNPAGNSSTYTGGFVDPNTNHNVDSKVLERYKGKRLPVVIRNNNPGAISITGKEEGSFAARQPGYVGKTARPANEGGYYAQYATPEHGVHAAANLLRSYGRDGVNTTDKIVRKWSTDTKAHAAYSKTLKRYLTAAGIKDVDGVLDLNNPTVLEAIVKAKSAHESGAGVPTYEAGVYSRGVAGNFGESGPLKQGDSTAFPSIAYANQDRGLVALPNMDLPGLNSAANVAMTMSHMNPNTTRNKPIAPKLHGQLQYAASQIGATRIDVTSGGQDPAGKGARRVGTSTNHDHGNAADFDIYVPDGKGGERKLQYSNPQDRVMIESFVENAVKAGVTNIGVGPGYMADGRLHVGNTGSDRVWGKTMEKGSAEPNIVAAFNRGKSQQEGFDLAAAMQQGGTESVSPNQVQIAQIDPKNRTHAQNVEHYSASSWLGSMFKMNRAAAAGLTPEQLKVQERGEFQGTNLLDSGFNPSFSGDGFLALGRPVKTTAKSDRLTPIPTARPDYNNIPIPTFRSTIEKYINAAADAATDMTKGLSDTVIDSVSAMPEEAGKALSYEHSNFMERILGDSPTDIQSRIDAAHGDPITDRINSTFGGIGTGVYPDTGIQSRIDQAHQAADAHITAEKIRPDINPQAAIANVSGGITIPESIDFASKTPTVHTNMPDNPIGNTGNGGIPNLRDITSSADIDALTPLIMHHLQK